MTRRAAFISHLPPFTPRARDAINLIEHAEAFLSAPS
jgi:hypothetical protein